MCQIISVPAGKEVNLDYLDRAQEHNKDGYGVAWYEDKMVKTYKTMNYDTFKGVLKVLTPFTKIVHLRYNTVGLTNIDNCHPFDVPNGVMFHNGTITSLKPTGRWDNKTQKYISPSKSDSKVLADILSECYYENIDDVAPLVQTIIGTTINKLAFLEQDGTVTIMNEDLGMEEDGIWYSNDYHVKKDGWCRHGECKPKALPPKKEKEEKSTVTVQPEKKFKVFVYGTLKRGHGNNHLLSKALYLGKAHTMSKWAMIGKGRVFPYVVEPKDSGYQVKGEVFEVNSQEMAALDRLEGVSSGHYKKQVVSVKYEDDTSDNDFVTMYVACRKPYNYENEELIEEWVG